MNPAGAFFQQLATAAPETVDYLAAIKSLGHAALLGLVLMGLTAWFSGNSTVEAASPDEPMPSPAERIFSAANVLYLCFGMSGMMLIVNNNIARAFAIAAAIALVRFRIKVNSKILSMALFYGVLTGMACGVGHSYIGYVLVVFFGVLQLFVLTAARIAQKRSPKKNQPRPLFAAELPATQSFYETDSKTSALD